MATFRTRARTVDMLGRQQIAGIPTAISELFKNAHDAYADRAEIDFYRSDGLFVLRDDGVGMNRKDFESRWLTIGTESKFDATHAPPIDRQKNRRPLLGEKGIGRLAIATIGPQLLVLTRPIHDDDEPNLTAAFLNWSIFEWPGIDLDEIEIPLLECPPGTLPSADDVSEMVGKFRVQAEAVGRRVERNLLTKLVDELKDFDVDPQDIDSYLQEPSLRGDGHGTHFLVKPASELLLDDIDDKLQSGGSAASGKATPLKRALLGFSNSMTPGTDNVIQTAFRDHRTDLLLVEDLIGNEQFFTPDEALNADHMVCGEFDEYGQFLGEVSIHGEKVPNHAVPWGGGHGAPTNCGPFSIRIAAFEGESRHSTIPHEDHARLANKAGQIGGLYIYRNGIRVLPYGDTDYDWLDIEYRRTKSAYYYYFSHRMMFGAVEIDADRNRNLRERAGREGFQENKAYRQFRSILRNFLQQLAADFFRKDGVYGDSFNLRKSELSREDKARNRRKELVKTKREEFHAELNGFFSQLENDAPQSAASELVERVENELRCARSMSDRRMAARKMLDLERKAHAEIRELEAGYRIARPKIGLSKDTFRDWNLYTNELESIRENVFDPTRALVENLIGEQARRARLTLDRQSRIEESLDELKQEALKVTKHTAIAVEEEAGEVARQAKDVAGKALKNVDSELRAVIAEFQRDNFDEMSDESFVKAKDMLEQRIQSAVEDQVHLLNSVLEQLQAIDVTGRDSTVDQLMAIEQRNLLLEAETDSDAHLAQLGMAVEIIGHEFSAAIRSLRGGLGDLKAWADANEELNSLFESIRTSFDHLDGHLTMFTPLQRRLYRKKVAIRGFEIREFLEELFQARLERHNVKIAATREFANATVVGFPSSIYPVFVNLVDNAIFWLSQQNPQHERRINLDERCGSLFISDNGPGIGVRDREAIFEFGFSRRPGGRGMGLHIGRRILNQIGFDLSFIQGDAGATFCIAPKD